MSLHTASRWRTERKSFSPHSPCPPASIIKLDAPELLLAGTFGAIGVTYGGPIVMVWGWLFVTACTLLVSLSMAELASAYPTSAALYYWAYVVAPKR